MDWEYWNLMVSFLTAFHKTRMKMNRKGVSMIHSTRITVWEKQSEKTGTFGGASVNEVIFMERVLARWSSTSISILWTSLWKANRNISCYSLYWFIVIFCLYSLHLYFLIFLFFFIFTILYNWLEFCIIIKMFILLIFFIFIIFIWLIWILYYYLYF